MGNFFKELKRRNVVRVGIAYAVLAWVLVQAADILLPTFGAPEGFLKGFYILLGLLFPLVLFFSWAFEITPEGVKKTKEVDQSKSVTHGTGQKINKMIAVGLVLALGFIAYGQFFAGDRPVHQAEAANASIAVLPFVNMSSDPEQDYFSDGISEELLNLLAKIPELQVAGRTSSFAFKGKNQDLREIGDTLGVSFLLEGSVRKQGNTVRITAQLIRTSDGIHLWSETYDRQLDDVFAIQDEISSAITSQLQIKILGAGQAPIRTQKVDAEAHSLYLLGLQHQNQLASQPYLDARDYYRRALEISPDYLDALWGLAFVSDDLSGFGTIENDEAAAEIERVLKRVQELGAGETPRATLLRAYLEAHQGSFDKYNELIFEAYAADPNDLRIVDDAANAFQRNNNYSKSIEIVERALKRDPLSVPLLRTLGNSQNNLGQTNQAEATFKKILEIDPGNGEGYAQLGFLNLQAGRWAEALKKLNIVGELDTIDPDIPVILASILSIAGFLDEAEVYLDKADAMSPNEVYSIAQRARVLAYKGNYSVAGIMAESLLLSDRPGRLGSSGIATNAAEYAFSQTGQYERLKNLILAHEPDLKRPLEDFGQDEYTIRNLNHMIGHSHELARALIGLGQEDEARALLEKAIEISIEINPDGETSGSIIPHLILLGRFDEAVERLSLPENITLMMWARVNPFGRWRAEPLQGHPGYEALAARIDVLVEAERAKIREWLAEQ